MRHPLLLALSLALAACSKPSGAVKPSSEAAPSPAPTTAAAPAAPAPQPARVDPDVPSGAAAARDAELARVAHAYHAAFSNSAPVFSPDGAQVLFVSTRDGLPQPYVADVRTPTAPARRLATTPQRVADVVALPDGKTALVRMDTGANENWSLFQVDLATGAFSELTPGEALQREAVEVPVGAPTHAFYAARKMAEKQSALHRLELRPGAAPEVVYRDAESGFLLDVSHDGTRALWLRAHSLSNTQLFAVDTRSGEGRLLYPAPGAQVTVHDARFSADGTRALVSTDGGAEESLVLSLDATTGKETARYVHREPATAAIRELKVARQGGTVAALVAAGNRTEVRLLDARTLRPRAARPALPLGAGGLGEFSPDGATLAVWWSAPGVPMDLHAVDVRSGRVRPLRQEPRPGLEGAVAVETLQTELVSHDGTKVPVHVYLPKGAVAAGKRLPVIVNFHGGPAGVSTIRWNPSAGFFLSQGWAWVEPNVRGSTGFGRAYEMGDNGPKREAALKDVDASAAWVAQQPWADPQRRVVYGGSYGGYTVLMALARQPDVWAAGVNLFGVADVRTLLASTSGVIRAVFREEFGELGKDDAMLAAQSPLTHVARIQKPLFTYAGQNDPRVPRSESDAIVRAVRARGVPVEYTVAPDEGHSLARRENWVQVHARIARFLETHVRPAPAAASPTP